jgi:hypothetical protein
MEGEANALRVAKQRKATGVPIFYVVYFRDVRLLGYLRDVRLLGTATNVHVRRLVRCESDIFLDPLNLHQEGVGMQSVVVQDRKSRARAADIELDERQRPACRYERMLQPV